MGRAISAGRARGRDERHKREAAERKFMTYDIKIRMAMGMLCAVGRVSACPPSDPQWRAPSSLLSLVEEHVAVAQNLRTGEQKRQ